jgi:hypothetical protein
MDSMPDIDNFSAEELNEPNDGFIVTAETFTGVVEVLTVSKDIDDDFTPLAISSSVSGVSNALVPSLGEIAAAVTRNESRIFDTADCPAYN